MIKVKPIAEKPKSSFTGSDFELKDEVVKAIRTILPDAKIETIITPAQIDSPTKIIDSTPIDEKKYCAFRGIIRKPSTGEPFQSSSEIHQNHSKFYTCLDVIFMERVSGRHGENCSFVGYLNPKKCCIKS